MLRFTADRFASGFQGLGLSSPAPGVYRSLAQAYGASGRFYHTQRHIEACLGHLDACRHLAEHPNAIEIALWFHDAVYNPRRGDNEVRSAAWARRLLSDCGAEVETIESISELIMATDHRSAAKTQDAQLLVDIDLAIFGQPPAVFADYNAQIRQEYRWVPEEEYRQKRKQVLEVFVERDRIYHTPYFYSRYEPAARQNLEYAIQKLIHTE